MLVHLSVSNVAIADHLDMEFRNGMTVITGETGAGKSILLDSLGLALGDRADAAMVRQGEERAEISASFDITDSAAARAWLSEHDLLAGDDCVLRRVITREGRSRGYINGRPCPLQSLKALGELLIDIHSQHAHQSLLKREQQGRLLDEFAGASDLVEETRRLAQICQQQQQRLRDLEATRHERDARAQLLHYQVEELDQLALAEDELEALEQEQQQLASGELILQASQHTVALCSEGELNVVSILNQALRSLDQIPAMSHAQNEARELLNSALIQTEEASASLQHHIDHFELDPARLHEVEQRLSAIYDIARKHHIKPEALASLHRHLAEELAQVQGSDGDIDSLQRALEASQQDYRQTAEKLSRKRQSAAGKLQKQVEKQLKQLAMERCQLRVQLSPRDAETPHPQGAEEVQFLVSTNAGQAPQSLAKIASGGELSRISLAIQVSTAQTSAIPTLVFDEVDVGVGGATAEVVGNLLQSLGHRGQVLCVTHQAQVASKGHHHLVVSKSQSRKTVSTQLQALDEDSKIQEIARMLGGIVITDQSLAHAREMLSH